MSWLYSESTDSNVNLIQKHLHRNKQDMSMYLGTMPSRIGTEN